MKDGQLALYGVAGVGALGFVWYLNRGTHPQVSGVVTGSPGPTAPASGADVPAGSSPSIPSSGTSAPFHSWLDHRQGVATHIGKPMNHPTDSITLYTYNGDFNRTGDRHDVLVNLIRNHGAQGVLGQELFSPGHPIRHLRNMLPTWHVNQGDKPGPNAMTGIAIDPSFTVRPRGHRHGLTPPPGVKLSVRTIAVSDVQVGGHWVRIIDIHPPPKRYRALWPVYMANVAAIKAASPYPVIIGGDFNALIRGRLVGAFAKANGLQRYGHDIDGFLYDPRLHITPRATVGNAATKSDHPFPGATFSWKDNVHA